MQNIAQEMMLFKSRDNILHMPSIWNEWVILHLDGITSLLSFYQHFLWDILRFSHVFLGFFTKQLQSSIDSVQTSVSWKGRFEFEAVPLAL